jgi:hypothetical protein
VISMWRSSPMSRARRILVLPRCWHDSHPPVGQEPPSIPGGSYCRSPRPNQTGRVRAARRPRGLLAQTPPSVVAFTRDGRRVATPGEDGAVRILGKPHALALPGQHGTVRGVAVSADSRLSAWSARADGTVRVWELPRRAPLGRRYGRRSPAPAPAAGRPKHDAGEWREPVQAKPTRGRAARCRRVSADGVGRPTPNPGLSVGR